MNHHSVIASEEDTNKTVGWFYSKLKDTTHMLEEIKKIGEGDIAMQLVPDTLFPRLLNRFGLWNIASLLTWLPSAKNPNRHTSRLALADYSTLAFGRSDFSFEIWCEVTHIRVKQFASNVGKKEISCLQELQDNIVITRDSNLFTW